MNAPEGAPCDPRQKDTTRPTKKKRIDLDRDTYLPRKSPKEAIQCAGCGALYHRCHWTLTTPTGFREAAHSRPIYFPACAKPKDRMASGEVHLVEVAAAERGDVLRILRNEERRAREKNPLERIMQMEASGGGWKKGGPNRPGEA